MFVSDFCAGFIPLFPYIIMPTNTAFPTSIFLSLATLLVLEALLMAMAPLLEEKMRHRFNVFEDMRDDFETFAAWPGGVVPPNARQIAHHTNGGKRGRRGTKTD